MFRKARFMTAVALATMLCVAHGAVACSPSGHVFVALAAIEKLKQSDDPETKKLAKVLEKYRWVVCHGSEGPDWVQRARGYQNSHYKVLFNVSYESPQSFDLKVAQPVFSGLLRDSYRVAYGLTTEDLLQRCPTLYIHPVPEKREISLAFAAGYISHLLSDYFCHRPALTWWEKDAIMQEATKRARPKHSYGPIQSVYACFLWKSHANEYGITDELKAQFLEKVDSYKQDNGVLPFCSLACSRKYYANWGIDVEKYIDPGKYEPCARPIVGPGHLKGCVDRDRKEAEDIFAETGRSFEENLRIGAELTPWRKVYDDVIEMVAQAWANAASEIGIADVEDTDVIADELAKPLPREIAVPAKPGSADCLQRHFGSALTGAVTRDGKREAFNMISDTTKAMFKTGWVKVQDKQLFGFLAHPPWKTGPGDVYADFRLALPKTDARIVFQSQITMHANLKDCDGATFKAVYLDEDGKERVLAEKHLTEKKWVPLEADLTEFAGKAIVLRLVVTPGPKDNTIRDNAAWGAPVIVILPK